jgi:hypothetical protein
MYAHFINPIPRQEANLMLEHVENHVSAPFPDNDEETRPGVPVREYEPTFQVNPAGTTRMLLNQGTRTIELNDYQVYRVPCNRLIGFADNRPDYGPIPDHFGVYKSDGYYKVVLSRTVYLTMLSFWLHRPGGKTSANFDISVIYFKNVMSNVDETAKQYYVSLKWAPVIAYLCTSDVQPRESMLGSLTIKSRAINFLVRHPVVSVVAMATPFIAMAKFLRQKHG